MSQFTQMMASLIGEGEQDDDVTRKNIYIHECVWVLNTLSLYVYEIILLHSYYMHSIYMHIMNNLHVGQIVFYW